MPILKKKDIYEGGNPFVDAQKGVEALQKSVIKLQKEVRTVNKESTGSAAKQRIDLTKKLEAETNKLAVAESKQAKELAKLKVQNQERNRLLKQEARDSLNLVGAYERQSKKLTELRKRYKDLAVQNKQNTKGAKALLSQITKLDSKLKKVDATVGQHQRSVGKYANALKGVGRQLLGAAGIIGGFTLLTKVIGNSVKIFKTFDKSSSRLASILGTTKDGIKGLTNQAKELGSTTAFTASEVISLQTELAKLGFTTQEIQNSTAAILDLAAATGSDLASSAELAGATLRIFNLDASEMQRVTDVLAKSTTISSLSMEKLATILPTVGKTAQIAGVSLERTAALAGTLTDRGIEASTAGTALRNIFLQLAKKGITWSDAMTTIRNSSDKLKTSTDLLGVRSSAAGIILSETATSTDDLTFALENANGAAQEMASTMLDNLAGDMTIAQSAWEGFVLSLEDGEGVISRVLRKATKLFTGLLTALKKVNEGESLYLQKLKKDSNFQDQVNKRWEKYITLLRLATSKEDEINIARTKRRQLQNKIRAIQFQLNKGEENGIKISTRRRAELELERDAYTELINRLGKFIPEIQKQNKLLEEGTEETDENTESTTKNTSTRDSNSSKIDKQSKSLRKLNEQLQREAEFKRIEERDRLDLPGVNQEDLDVSEMEALDAMLDAELKAVEENEQKISDARLESRIKTNNEILDKDIELIKAVEELKEKALQESISFATDAASIIVDDKKNKELSRIKAEEDALKNQLEQGLINETQYQRKLTDLEKQRRIAEAKAERRKALFNIAINTAVGVVKALPNFIAAAAVAVFGGIQAALVAARPLPKFKDGIIGIDGPGTTKSDSIPAMLSKNESVITAEGTNNAPMLLDAINRGMIRDKDLGLTQSQKANLTANMLMKGMLAKSDEMIALLRKGGYAVPKNGFVEERRVTGEVIKHIV